MLVSSTTGNGSGTNRELLEFEVDGKHRQSSRDHKLVAEEFYSPPLATLIARLVDITQGRVAEEARRDSLIEYSWLRALKRKVTGERLKFIDQSSAVDSA